MTETEMADALERLATRYPTSREDLATMTPVWRRVFTDVSAAQMNRAIDSQMSVGECFPTPAEVYSLLDSGS
jgi:hypothetical protein